MMYPESGPQNTQKQKLLGPKEKENETKLEGTMGVSDSK